VSLAPAGQRDAAVEEIERIVAAAGEADEILRESIAVLARRIPAARWVGIAFVEEGALALGPVTGSSPAAAPPAVRAPVSYDRARVAEIWIDADGPLDADDEAFLGRVGDLLSPYCLVGWDTGGEAWVND
jgi:hypothetical protein